MLQTYEKCHEDQIVVHNIPIVYHLDDLSDITELKGLYGSKLRANVHIVTASKFALLNIKNCLGDCNLNVAGCVVESYASGMSCITQDEKELGAMIIDIGGKYTSVGIFSRGKFVYADSIPLGGMHITNDIAYGLCVNVKDAERIKVLYGDALLTSPDKDGIIEADVGDDEVISVTRSNLVKIINPRVEEIFDLVKNRVGRQRNLISKVVITGGSSRLSNIKEVASCVLTKQVKIGLPVVLKGINDDYKYNPVFSAAIGMTSLVLDTLYNEEGTKPKKNGIVERFLRLIPIRN
ncbi:MAG: cell division protein FtsA [Ehrlichia sp.]